MIWFSSMRESEQTILFKPECRAMSHAISLVTAKIALSRSAHPNPSNSEMLLTHFLDTGLDTVRRHIAAAIVDQLAVPAINIQLDRLV
jgi:hypothetical protein